MFNAMSSLNGGTLDTYYLDSEYPYDLNGSLDYTRPQSAPNAIYGFPNLQSRKMMGSVSGLLPLFNTLEYSMMFGKTPWGTWLGDVPTNQMMQNIFPNIGGGLRKVNG
jgi:hypothetical protein